MATENHTSETPLKKCTKCGIEKPATPEYFFRHKRCPDGLRARCKGCVNEDNADYLERHPGKKQEMARNRLSNNRESINAKIGEWRNNNPEKYKAISKRYRDKRRASAPPKEPKKLLSPEEKKRRRSERQKHRRKENPEQVREIKARSYQKNKDKALAYGREYIKRRPEVRRASLQKRRGAVGIHTSDDILMQIKSQKYKCWWCGKKLKQYHIDHRIPLAKGGTNWPGNIVIACPKCNLSKGAKMPHEWNGRLL